MIANFYGASSSDWDMLMRAGLTSVLLPVVQNPGIRISAKSHLQAIGKLPSRKNSFGELAGFPKWTEHETTEREIEAWRRDPDLGICIRLDGMAALDCDSDDDSEAQAVLAIARKHFGDALPLRTRADAPRWLAPLRLADGDRTKQRIALKSGACLEVLGKGQQFVACGTHPKGCRYTWTADIAGMPTVTNDALDAFLAEVVEACGAPKAASEKKPGRKRGPTDLQPDRLRDWLRQSELFIAEREPGVLELHCPWEHEHTGGVPGDGSSTYYSAGTHGYREAAYICLHAHCEGRNVSDLTAWAVEHGFERIDPAMLPLVNVIDAAEGAGDPGPAARDQLVADLRPYMNKNGSIQTSLPALYAALMAGRWYLGVEIGDDSFTGGPAMRRSGEPGWTPMADADAVRLRLKLQREKRFSTIPKDLMRDAICLCAAENPCDMMVDYLDRTIPQWDGVDRSDFLVRLCGAEDSPLAWAIGRYILAALWGRAHTPKGIKADIAPVLVGPQGARKSTLVRVLALDDAFTTDITFASKDTDNARQIRGKITVELPELAGLSRRDLNEVKRFISLERDEYIPKYQEFARSSARRCVFFMTTNEHDFLTDATGNRRYAPIEVHDIDIDGVKAELLQLWAQGRDIFGKEGINHRPLEQLTVQTNEQYMRQDPWVDSIREFLERWEALPADDVGKVPLTAVNILSFGVGISVSRVSTGDGRRLALVMAKLGYEQARAYVNGVRTRAFRKKPVSQDDVPF